LFNLQGLEQGRLNVNLTPCLPSGHTLTEEHFIDQPDELLNKRYHFKVNYSFLSSICSTEQNHKNTVFFFSLSKIEKNRFLVDFYDACNFQEKILENTADPHYVFSFFLKNRTLIIKHALDRQLIDYSNLYLG